MIRRIIQRIRRAVHTEPEHPSMPAMRERVAKLGDRVRELDRWRADYQHRKNSWSAA